MSVSDRPALRCFGQNTNFASFLALNNGKLWEAWLAGPKKVIDHLRWTFLNCWGSYMISQSSGLASASNIICNEPGLIIDYWSRTHLSCHWDGGCRGMPWEHLPFCPSWLKLRIEVTSLPNDSERSHQVCLEWGSAWWLPDCSQWHLLITKITL